MTALSSTSAPITLTAGRLPSWTTAVVFTVAVLASASLFFATGSLGLIRVLLVSVLIFTAAMMILSLLVEGSRKATDRLARIVVTSAFGLALLPLVSLVFSVIEKGAHRFDAQFFSYSMRNVVGEGGGAVHAITGTLWVTGIATLISVPIGVLAAIYLVEYGSGKLARSITFFVDVMTGIPSIVAGLFAYALFVLVVGVANGTMGITGAVALCVLMIPYIVRSSEEMLQLVPRSLREASYALGVPKWRTILKVVIPTALSGIVSGVVLGIARVIGETAPLLITAGFVDWKNPDPVNGAMATLPVFVYKQYMTPGVPQAPYYARAWTGALTLILIVMVLNLLGRLIAARFAPHTSRK